MKRIIILCVTGVWFFSGCQPKAPKIEIGGYTFGYEGKNYRIESITPNFLEGYNVLSKFEEDKIVFKAMDREQDGVLDEVVIGDLALEEARIIYREGLKEGERRGYLHMRTFAREYRIRIGHNQYILATYILALGDVYNKLTLKDIANKESILVDMDSDGILDKIESGDKTLGEYQKFYRLVLDEGLQYKKITRTDGLYLVEL